MTRFLCGLAPVCLVVISIGSAQAQFVKIDDFQSYSVGSPIDGQGWWTSEVLSAAGADVVADPLAPANRVLSFGQAGPDDYFMEGHREAVNTAPQFEILDGTVATIYYRAFFPAASHDVSLGMTYQHNPISDADFNTFGAYESQLSLFGGAPAPDLRSIDSLGEIPTIVNDIQPGVWYDIWSVVDNGSNTARYYIQGGAFAAQTLLTDGIKSDFQFRHFFSGPTDEALQTFQLTTGSTNGPILIDDVHIDNSGVNLAVPSSAPAVVKPIVTEFGLQTDSSRSQLTGQLISSGEPVGNLISMGLSGPLQVRTKHLPGDSVESAVEMQLLGSEILFDGDSKLVVEFEGGQLVLAFTEMPEISTRGMVPRVADALGEFPTNRVEVRTTAGIVDVALVVGSDTLFADVFDLYENFPASPVAIGETGRLSFAPGAPGLLNAELEVPVNIEFPVDEEGTIVLLLTGTLVATGVVPVPEPSSLVLLAGAAVVGVPLVRRRFRRRSAMPGGRVFAAARVVGRGETG